MGYVNDTAMSQYIPPTAMHFVTGTWTEAAGQTAGTIVKIKGANAETSVITVPIMIPSNSVALKGGYLKSVEVDYEIRTAAATSITASMKKVVRGADGSDAAPATVVVTQDLVAATDAADVDEHKLVVTITTPFWIDNDEYVLLVLTAICAAGTVLEILGAVANYTLRV